MERTRKVATCRIARTPVVFFALLVLLTPSCGATNDQPADPSVDSKYHARREAMVRVQIQARGVQDPAVLEAMRKTQRHLFVPEPFRISAYSDHPLRIGHGQTISQPYIVALMTELAEVKPGDRVLEVGTGSAYQAAVLAEIGAEVYTIEIVEPLATSAAQRLKDLGYDSVHVRHGDGYAGWPEVAPFDAILVTAAPPSVPEPLKQQLAVGAKLVIPVGERYQRIVVIERTESGFNERDTIPVTFVPMTGKAQEKTK